ncbi:MAG: tRNA (adenosine(37)-N6)-threonylcarbamoyltransferase complex transferase subunit TsaD [Ignavibacteriae bacterium]|nr:tRNA (adenosine(37)-N6)-threonylcarbamoyltransferase complex transferase subunit TsaD [Ignavibacteriota bacterium]MCB9220749.1 tRNA (adenosine(37)-N6)-threonylcarbamoyltransferase complex transferase subunit TsaD [Ignavibacteria bacterium]
MKILAIESSCDDTSIAVLSENKVLSNVISSQAIHRNYGGIVPELASRAHINNISSLTEASLVTAGVEMKDINAIAVTSEPGLMGSLIVGSSFAKGLSLKYDLPLIPVNHIEGHIYSGCLEDESLDFPFISLVVSGGHTSLFLVESYSEYITIGMTKDDAAGEAFDKIAKLMGLGYPGGPIIDKLAKEGNPTEYDFPRSMINSDDFDFSFSGLKTAVRYFIQKNFEFPLGELDKKNIAASVQAAIVDVLIHKTYTASKKYKVKNIVIGGGVSANSLLRKKFHELELKGFKIVIPKMEYCIDNAAMIGFLADKKIQNTNNDYKDLTFKVSSRPMRSN